MGRKKRKVESEVGGQEVVASDPSDFPELPPRPDIVVPTDTHVPSVKEESIVSGSIATNKEAQKDETKPVSSAYAMTSHSGEIITEDIYVSDGSVDSDDDDGAEIVLTGSRMGLMRRGLHQQMMALQQPNRQWKRQDAASTTDGTTPAEEGDVEVSKEAAEEIRRQREEEELALLDPAQRAARLLIEKQKRELEAKLEERRLENEENVMRDPTLFSKRTAFDIRFDQIDDKPWVRAGGTDNVSDFFNYGLSEEDWLEYAEQQLLIRQELIDAARQKRPPDPTLVPIQPRAKQEGTTVVAAAPSIPLEKNESASMDIDVSDAASPPLNEAASASIGPTVRKPEEILAPQQPSDVQKFVLGSGGAWGAGAVPGSLLARLMEEQGQPGASGDDDMKLLTSPSMEEGRHDDESRYRASSKGGKKDRDHFSRRGSDMDSETHSSHHRDNADYYSEEYDYYGGGSRNRSNMPPPGWPPPQGDAYGNFPPPPGYHGSGGGRGGRSGGGRGGNFPPRGGRGGRGNNDRDSGGRGGGPDYYQDAPPPSGGGWKRSRSGDSRRRH